MKILMIASYLPYPLYSGGQVRLYNLIKEISKEHQITLICEKRKNQSTSDIDVMKKICSQVITVPRHKQWAIKNILKTAISPNSFLLNGHSHNTMKQKIKKELENNEFDLIHVETYYVAQNLPPTNLPIILVEHNIEYQVYQRYADIAPIILRPLLRIDINKIKKEEHLFWKKATKLIAVSEDDKKIMQQIGLQPNLVPNGVNPEQFSYKNIEKSFSQKTKKILFIGDFKWLQNRDSASFIIKDIWPKIKSKYNQNISLWIVGRNFPENLKKLSDNMADIYIDKKS
jgi:glycosyltransferase involved in cell wall biosynthesis